MPAQALRQRHNNPIGFSIYVVSEGNDDVSGLVDNQGFMSQGQPHSVQTPYGELGWKVFYAPKNPMIQRLLPEKSPYETATTSPGGRGSGRARSQPIPMQQQQQPHQSPGSGNRHMMHHRVASSPKPIPGAAAMMPTAAHSAPHPNARMYRRSNSATPDMISDGHAHPNMMGRSAQPLRSNSGYPSFAPLQQQHQPQVVQQSDHHRSNNSDEYNVPLSSSADTKPPTKSMSGLSLAMMQSDDTISDNDNKSDSGGNNNNNFTTPSKDGVTNNADAAPAQATMESSADKRRAALHHAPPQFGSVTSSPQVMKKSVTSTGPGEYGYGYNNHIPIPNAGGGTATMTAATIAENTSQEQQPGQSFPRSSTPTTPLSSTPPGYLLGVGATPPAMSSNFLIPPRSAVTPPFVRPMGFVVEPPNQLNLPDASTSATGAAQIPDLKSTTTVMTSQQQLKQQSQPTTSLDLLHSSPFQHVGSQHHHHAGSALFRGIDPASSVFPPPATYNAQSLNTELPHFDHHLSIQQQLFADPHTGTSSSHAFGGSHSNLHHHASSIVGVGGDLNDSDDDCMPFAVDDPIENGTPNNASTTIGGSLGMSSLSTATSAQQRKKKLAMFESSEHQSVTVASLADQLAEFKSFGASINLGTAGSSSTTSGGAPVAAGG